MGVYPLLGFIPYWGLSLIGVYPLLGSKGFTPYGGLPLMGVYPLWGFKGAMPPYPYHKYLKRSNLSTKL
jgi:hypothetical protein